jgi:hypothetical protein
MGNGNAKWCSERCRKNTLYGGKCEDCSVPTSGGSGHGPARWCQHCVGKHRINPRLPHCVKCGVTMQEFLADGLCGFCIEELELTHTRV